MYSKFKKLILLSLLYPILLVIDGCIMCKCPDVVPFFDYENVDIISNQDSLLANNGEIFEMSLLPQDVNYLVCKPGFSLGLINSALACSCIYNGFEGAKFPTTSLNIFANRSFHDSIPVTENLNDLFQIEYYENGENKLKPLASASLEEIAFLADFQPLDLFLEASPDSMALDEPFIFKVEITKSNGEIVEGFSPEIKWK